MGDEMRVIFMISIEIILEWERYSMKWNNRLR